MDNHVMYKYYSTENDIQMDEKTISGIASVESVDRDGDVVFLDGLDISKYMKNPVVLFQHNNWDDPIGKSLSVRKQIDINGDKILSFSMLLDTEDEKVSKIYNKIKRGFLKGISIGFIPLEYKKNKHGGYDITKSELYEISIVNVGANSDAVITSVKSLIKEVGLTVDEKDKPNEKPIDEVTIKTWVKDSMKELMPEFAEFILSKQKQYEEEKIKVALEEQKQKELQNSTYIKIGDITYKLNLPKAE